MIAPPVVAVPPPALAAAVHAGRWIEVRAVTMELPAPLSPAVALAAARAARMLGEPARAEAIIRQALPRAGALGTVLRIEGGESRLAAGLDPWPVLEPLVTRPGPAAPRWAALALLEKGWRSLPIAVVRRQPRRALSRGLRRSFEATLAERSGDARLAMSLVAERHDDAAALRAARMLAARPLDPAMRLPVGRTLLAGGAWREAAAVLATVGTPARAGERVQLAFLRGRAAYRLGAWAEASAAFEAAIEIAPDADGRFSSAVQRARIAEIAGDFSTAVRFFDVARTAAPREVEGWDGGARARAAGGHGDDAAELLLRAPPAVLRTAGARTAAVLLARGETVTAGRVIARLPGEAPTTRLLEVLLARRLNRVSAADAALVALLADRHAEAWREVAAALLPVDVSAEGPCLATREPAALARLAVARGAGSARDALAAALALDSQWAAVATGGELATPVLDPAIGDLLAVGFERDAAMLLAYAFPRGSPAELAWTACFLAIWGNSPAALTAGETLWARLGGIPAALLPAPLHARITPSGLTTELTAAAGETGAPAPWLFGVIRQESRFDPGARSRAGALGLAQFVPAALERAGASAADAFDPVRALRLAGGEMVRLRMVFGGRMTAVAASYNAGEAVVAAWLAELGPGADDALLALAIPYSETAGYVLAVGEGARLADHLD